jgi:hypothetical protein
MTWEELGRNFLRVPKPFWFLASSPTILRVTSDIGPVQLSASLLAAVVSGLAIAVVYLKLKPASKKCKVLWFLILGAVFLLLLPCYIYLDSTYVYRTDPPSSERRVRGFEYVSEFARKYVEEEGSVREALKGNFWQSDGIFTEQSKNTVSVGLFILWNLVFAVLCGAIATFALIEFATTKAKAETAGGQTDPPAAEPAEPKNAGPPLPAPVEPPKPEAQKPKQKRK